MIGEKEMKWKIYDVIDYAQRPTGRHFAVCPYCNYVTDDFRLSAPCWRELTNYCPNCGANMREATVDNIPIKDIKDFLRCEKIDSCDWLNCSECSQMKCISIRNLNDLIEWSKEKENEKIFARG